jgi:hypothetical protein
MFLAVLASNPFRRFAPNVKEHWRAVLRRKIPSLTACFVLLLLQAAGCGAVFAQQPATDGKISSPAAVAPVTTAVAPDSAQYYKPSWGIIEQPVTVVARPLPEAPETVVIPAGTRIAVALDTPLSTRISKTGQIVNFRTTEALPVYQDLVIPADTLFTGKVVEAHKPGSFGKSGVLRVKVDRIELPNGTGTNVIARLDSQDVNAQGRLQSDKNRTANLMSLALWSLQGTLLGAQVHGGKGAAVGAGAGAATALILLMSRHGADIYLEPGTPFAVLLDQNVSLPGRAVAAAQPASANPSAVAENPRSASDSPASLEDPTANQGRPKLKHRPKPRP